MTKWTTADGKPIPRKRAAKKKTGRVWTGNPDLAKQLSKVKDLHLDPSNARAHPDRNVEAVMNSLQEFGQQEPLVVAGNGKVIAGNARLQAAKRLGWTHVAVVRFPSEEAARQAAYGIASNRTAELAAWDDEVLARILGELRDEDPELAEFVGFSDEEYEALLEGLEPEGGGAGSLEEVEPGEPPSDPQTQIGDVWTLGNHRIACGDSLNGSLVDDILAGEQAGLVFTDPPYNVNLGSIKHPEFKQRTIENDHMPAQEWAAFCDKLAALLHRASGGCVYVCHAPGPDGRVLARALDGAMHWSATIAWVKNVFVLGRGKYHRRYEPIWFGWPEKAGGKRFTKARDLDDVWEIPRPTRSDDHPTMKPVALVACALEHASKKGDTVFDPFGGSGTTLVAAEQMDRKARLIELDPRYVDVTLQRWHTLTDQLPVNQNGGKYTPRG